MKKAILLILLTASVAYGQFPTNVSSKTVDIDKLNGDFRSHRFKWIGENDQRVSLTFTSSTSSAFIDLTGYNVAARIGQDGTTFVDKESSTVTIDGSNISFEVDRTNVPPNGTYNMEVYTWEGATTNTTRTLSQGTVDITKSLYSDTNAYPFPASPTSLVDYLTIVSAVATYAPISTTPTNAVLVESTSNAVTWTGGALLTWTINTNIAAGDITSVTVTGGFLTGGTNTGAAVIDLSTNSLDAVFSTDAERDAATNTVTAAYLAADISETGTVTAAYLAADITQTGLVTAAYLAADISETGTVTAAYIAADVVVSTNAIITADTNTTTRIATLSNAVPKLATVNTFTDTNIFSGVLSIATNTWFVPISVDLDAFIASSACKAGDTIEISGTRTIFDDIDVGKGITIRGTGVGNTSIVTTNDGMSVFHVLANNVTIQDLSIDITADGTEGIKLDGTAGTVLTGIIIKDCQITQNSHAGAQVGIQAIDVSGEVWNTTISGISTNDLVRSVSWRAAATAEGTTTGFCYNVHVIADGGSNESFGFGPRDVTASQDTTLILKNCSATVTENAAHSSFGALASGGDAFLIAENCLFSGTDYDIGNDGAGGVTIYDTTLVNGTTSGTVTQAGETLVGLLTATGVVDAASFSTNGVTLDIVSDGDLTAATNAVTTAFLANDTVVSNASLQNVVEDTTPQSGGDYDAQGFDFTNVATLHVLTNMFIGTNEVVTTSNNILGSTFITIAGTLRTNVTVSFNTTAGDARYVTSLTNDFTMLRVGDLTSTNSELVVNGSFTNSNAWVLTNATWVTSQSNILVSFGQTATIGQSNAVDFTVTAGRVYAISFARTTANSAEIISLSMGGQTQVLSAAATGVTTQMFSTVNAEPFLMTVNAQTNSVYIDDISVKLLDDGDIWAADDIYAGGSFIGDHVGNGSGLSNVSSFVSTFGDTHTNSGVIVMTGQNVFYPVTNAAIDHLSPIGILRTNNGFQVTTEDANGTYYAVVHMSGAIDANSQEIDGFFATGNNGVTNAILTSTGNSVFHRNLGEDYPLSWGGLITMTNSSYIEGVMKNETSSGKTYSIAHYSFSLFKISD